MINGNLTGPVMWLVNLLLLIVMSLIGFIVTLHMKGDKERHDELKEDLHEKDLVIWQELIRHRARLHDIIKDISDWKVEMIREANVYRSSKNPRQRDET